MRNALRACEQRIGELLRSQRGVPVHVFEPFGRIARRVLQLEHFHSAFGLILAQRRADVTRVRGQLQVERDGIFEGELAAGADTEVRGMRRVAQ